MTEPLRPLPSEQPAASQGAGDTPAPARRDDRDGEDAAQAGCRSRGCARAIVPPSRPSAPNGRVSRPNLQARLAADATGIRRVDHLAARCPAWPAIRTTIDHRPARTRHARSARHRQPGRPCSASQPERDLHRPQPDRRWPSLRANRALHGGARRQPHAIRASRPSTGHAAGGKPAKVAIIAIARKLLVLANASSGRIVSTIPIVPMPAHPLTRQYSRRVRATCTPEWQSSAN